MAQVTDPKKAFQFNIFAAGLNPYAAQSVDIPDFDIDIIEHGDTDHDVKTAGRIKYGNVKIEKLRPIGLADGWVWDWIQSIRNVDTGGGQLAREYKRNISIVQLSYDNITITDEWVCEGAWPSKLNGLNLSRVKSENSMETVELSIDRCRKTR
jgi:phage tail-like protein